MRYAASPALGYWATELGGINQVIHIWPYDSLQQRTQIRQNLALDPAWNKEYMDLMRPMLDKQFNSLLLPLVPISVPKAPGFYHLRIHRKNHYPIPIEGVTLVGSWQSIIGEQSYFELWHSSEIDQLLQNPNTEGSRQSKLLIPLPFSPLK